MSRRLGVWTVGAYGGVGTTMVLGARAIAAGLVSDTGVATNQAEFAPLQLVDLGDIVFGGHDVRDSGFSDSAYHIAKASGSIDLEVLGALREELDALSANVKTGTALNCGAAISALVPAGSEAQRGDVRATVKRLRADLAAFREAHDLEHVVVVNLASTEPDLLGGGLPSTAAELEQLLDAGDPAAIRPSLLYACAAFEERCAFLNFTPSSAALCAGVQELGVQRGLPFMGSDGKTGETLVKSALAPMFKYRYLRVLSWQGYNILGDRDGEVLAHQENLASKVRSKDSVLSSILGYDLHTHVGIDYVPSLDDLKTAWDFIHFKGFLDHKMSMQFTWHGCDAILAAPLVLDMCRLAELALRRGEVGAMTHLAPYFKSPLGGAQQDLHRQFHAMVDYLRARGMNPGTQS